MTSRTYRHLCFGAALAALAAMCAPAYAADVYEGEGSLKDEPFVEPPPRGWGGIYVGGHVGYGWGSFNPTEVDPVFAALIDEELEHDPDGGVLGVQLGYNWQRSHFVFGIEGDIAGSNIEGDLEYDFVLGPGDTFTDSQTFDLDYLATIRARLGYDTGPLLLYLTGGWAVARVDSSFTATVVGPGVIPDGTISGSDSATYNGWVFGGGVEAWVRDNVSLRIEYLYADFDEEIHTPVPGLPGEPFDLDMDLVRVGVNFHF
jgi:outer membrane immunogenic protein